MAKSGIIVVMVRSHRAPPLRVTIAAWLRAAVLCRVLFPALMEAGAGKQNAVVVIVVRRCARLVAVSGLISLFYHCSHVGNCPLLAIIGSNGHIILPLKTRL